MKVWSRYTRLLISATTVGLGVYLSLNFFGQQTCGERLWGVLGCNTVLIIAELFVSALAVGCISAAVLKWLALDRPVWLGVYSAQVASMSYLLSLSFIGLPVIYNVVNAIVVALIVVTGSDAILNRWKAPSHVRISCATTAAILIAALLMWRLGYIF